MWLILYKTDKEQRYKIQLFSSYARSFEYEQKLRDEGIKITHQQEFVYDEEKDEFVLLNEINHIE